jgi:hypothetical protein
MRFEKLLSAASVAVSLTACGSSAEHSTVDSWRFPHLARKRCGKRHDSTGSAPRRAVLEHTTPPTAFVVAGTGGLIATLGGAPPHRLT